MIAEELRRVLKAGETHLDSIRASRPGTPAGTMDDQVAKDLVQDRYERLIDLQESISAKRNAALLGETMQVLVETPGRKGGLQGRTRTNKIAHFPENRGEAGRTPEQGSFADVRITATHPHYLEGDLVGAPVGVS